MGFDNFQNIGLDSYKDGSFIMDWQAFWNKTLLPSYIREPLVARTLNASGSGTLIPVDFDGKRVMNIPIGNDVDEPAYEWQPGVKDTGLSGDEMIARMPQIYETIKFSKDELKMMFAGKARLPLAMSLILEKFAEFEDTKVFQGDATKKVIGLVGSETLDLGDPTAAWGIKTSTTNVLDNAVLDVNKAIDYFSLNNLTGKPIDMLITPYIWNIFRANKLPYGGISNMQYIKEMLNGGNIIMSSRIQAATIEATVNSALFIVRDPKAWALISSGIEREQEKIGLWSWRYGMREKFSVKVLNAGLNNAGNNISKYICWMDGISNAAS